MRYPIIDGFRGFFLLFMMIIHVNDVVDTVIGKLNHHYLGWVEDAQGFVFISGLVVGLVYGGILLRKSYGAMQNAIWRRISTIYTHQAGLIAIFAAAGLAALVTQTPAGILGSYQGDPVAFVAASLMLVSASSHMGILPMYLYFMVLTPFALWALARGYGLPVLMVSALAWIFAQTGGLDVVETGAEAALASTGNPVRLGIFFNIFGWQALFFGGLYAGFLLAQGKLDLGWLQTPGAKVAALIGIAGIAGFALLDRLVYWDLISPEFTETMLTRANRQDFSPVHLINFVLDLYVVVWLLVAGRDCGAAWLVRLSAGMHWLFTRPALVFLGQHSLHVFSFHILWVYVLAVVFDAGPPSELMGTGLIVLSVALLYLPAWAHAQWMMWEKRQRVMMQPAE